jgi:glucokinase
MAFPAQEQPRTLLVGDVGGTHARFAIIEADTPAPWQLQRRIDFDTSFAGLSQAVRTYLERAGIDALPDTVAVAVAGPVRAGRVRFTNRDWQASEEELLSLGFRRGLLINDFAALAFAAEALSSGGTRAIGPELEGAPGEPISIVGAGTGFGVSCLVRSPRGSIAIATEAGHIGFAPETEREIAVLRVLSGRFGRVSLERLVSGPGLENLYEALLQLDGQRSEQPSAAEISAHALKGVPACQEALRLFCAIFGAAAGDIALAHGARGGVFIAGGIAAKIEGFLRSSDFRARFESKGRLSPFTQAIPTRLIVDPNAALLGAARAALQPTS